MSLFSTLTITSTRLRAPVESTLPSLMMRNVSERVVIKGESWLNISRLIPGTFKSHALFGKKPEDRRYEIIA
jgi:hypothetical protein